MSPRKNAFTGKVLPLCGAGKISADHENDAEFTEGVRESENDSGNYAGERKRKNDLEKCAPGICAEDAGSGVGNARDGATPGHAVWRCTTVGK